MGLTVLKFIRQAKKKIKINSNVKMLETDSENILQSMVGI